MDIKKIGAVAAVSAILFGTLATEVLAVSPTTGQPGAPNVTCGTGNATTMPAGFSTGGFAIAGSVYAGSDGTASLQNSQSTVAISQYDVACLQLTSH